MRLFRESRSSDHLPEETCNENSPGDSVRIDGLRDMARPAQNEAETALSTNAQSSEPIVVGGEKQLFIDGRFLAHSRNVELQMNSPVKLGVVIRPERPWEDKSIGFCASVIEHEGVFKAFYRADSQEKGELCALRLHATDCIGNVPESASTSLAATRTTTSYSATPTTAPPIEALARQSCSSTLTAALSSVSR